MQGWSRFVAPAPVSSTSTDRASAIAATRPYSTKRSVHSQAVFHGSSGVSSGLRSFSVSKAMFVLVRAEAYDGTHMRVQVVFTLEKMSIIDQSKGMRSVSDDKLSTIS